MKLHLNLAFGLFLLGQVTAQPFSGLEKRGNLVDPYQCNGGSYTINCPNDFVNMACQGTCANGDVWAGNCYANAP